MMNNRYILCKLGAVKDNAFFVDFGLILTSNGKRISGSAKIDTGCENTSISLQSDSVGMKKSGAMKLKEDAIKEKLKAQISFGVNDSIEFREEQKCLFRSKQYMKCTVIKFTNRISDFTINGYNIRRKDISVSYDRTSNVLIGMDILKDFDYHCGDSYVSDKENNISKGDHIFIGCLKDDINEAYLKALKLYLGYIPDYGRIGRLICSQKITLSSSFVRQNYDVSKINK